MQLAKNNRLDLHIELLCLPTENRLQLLIFNINKSVYLSQINDLSFCTATKIHIKSLYNHICARYPCVSEPYKARPTIHNDVLTESLFIAIVLNWFPPRHNSEISLSNGLGFIVYSVHLLDIDVHRSDQQCGFHLADHCPVNSQYSD